MLTCRPACLRFCRMISAVLSRAASPRAVSRTNSKGRRAAPNRRMPSLPVSFRPARASRACACLRPNVGGRRPALTPDLVAGTDRTVLRRGQAEIDGSDHPVAVQRRRYRLPESGLFENGALFGIDEGYAGRVFTRIQVEPQEVHAEPGAEVPQGEVPCLGGSPQAGIVLRAYRAKQIEFARFKSQGLSVPVLDDQQRQRVEIGKSPPGFVLLPEKRIPFEHHLDAALIFLQAERPQADDLLGRRRGPPGGSQRAVLIGFQQLIPGEDRDGVEGAQAGADRPRQGDSDGVASTKDTAGNLSSTRS